MIVIKAVIALFLLCFALYLLWPVIAALGILLIGVACAVAACVIGLQVWAASRDK